MKIFYHTTYKTPYHVKPLCIIFDKVDILVNSTELNF